jgi:TonB family protein
MSKQIIYLVAAILLSAVVLQAQDTGDVPFLALDNALKTEQHRWAGDKTSLSRIFDDERKRLGPRFESELLKWLENDAEKHYWVSGFLNWETYLQGNKRLPELSLLIKQQGLTLVQGKDDYDSRGHFVGLSFTAAILSDELGLRALANSYKAQAEELLKKDPSLGAHVPAVSLAERRRYDEIGPADRGVKTVVGVTSEPTEVPETPPPHVPFRGIMGGVLNGKALKLAKPSYPQEAREARVSGTVQVEVVIDENGKVIYAQAIGGHPLLRKASEDAASRSEFSPTKLSGVPVKVRGVIQYNFVARR